MSENTDKIFFNSFYESDSDGSQINFNVDDYHKIDSYDNKIDEEQIYQKVISYFESEEWLKKYITAKNVTENTTGEFPKISKLELNEIYSFFREKFNNNYLIELFSVLIEILDLNQSKFYESLSNTFKDELIEQLRKRGFLQKQYRLF